jgi:8-oxo-dGTP pyrophosphatase MutT (NUDIX family)
MSTVWRPKPLIRPIAIGIVRRADALLAVAVRDDTGAITGWRPLGGTIELGERAADAVQREFMEELGEPITAPKLVTVLESIYTHHGAQGHEIVFVFATAFADADVYTRDSFRFRDGGVDNTAHWVDIARLRNGQEQLFPAGLLEVL